MVAHPFSKKFSFLLLILCFMGLVLQTTTTYVEDFPDFDTYCEKFNKNYENGQKEQRRQIYNQNIKKIINSNCSAMGINMFTDSSQEEMQQLKGGFEVNIPQDNLFNQNSNNDSNSIMAAGLTLTDKTPLSYDWRDYKAVTSVKNQKSCGSCWAFSTTAFFQSDFIINNNYTNEIDLSQQFLLKCDNRSLQCSGGFLFWAMNRIIDETTGMPTEKQYPYDYSKISLQNGMCYETDLIRVDQKKKMVAYFDVEETKFIEKMILKKPVNVNLCSKDMQFYSPRQNSRTLFCDVNNAKRDHTVLLVGYTQTEWIIKNQWSNSWGVEGYGYISKNPDQDCCIGKQLYTTGVISSNCSVANCSICVQETSCYQCKQGFYIRSSQGKHVCTKCNQQYCEKCLNFFGLCDLCQSGYSLTYPYYTCQKSTIENCSFMYMNQCGQCHKGYALDMNGKCVAQKDACYVTGCQQCKEYQPGVCNTCSSGYKFNNFTSLCDKIPECNVENCSRCFVNDANRCEKCSQQGYEFSQIQSKCALTCSIDGCQSCDMVNSANTNTVEKYCAKCRLGYKLSQDKLSCQKCQLQYCADCSQNVTLCNKCLNGFYFNTNTSKCQPCSDIDSNCQQCSFDMNTFENKLICTKCDNGFSVSENNTQCIRCLSECITTSYFSLNVCSDKCGPMNYFAQNVCNKCPQNCQQCSSGTSCTKCLSGFVLKDDTCYKPCKQGAKCRNCRLDINQSECLSCANGYKLQNNQCVFNPQDQCLQKNGLYPDDCVSCPQKYYMNSNYSIKICSKCETTDQNCIECFAYSPGKCSKCADSYYLEKVNQTCIKCDTFDVNCIKCSANNLCIQCQQGHYLLSTLTNNEKGGICYPCNPSCLTCKYNSQFCTSCAQGYQLTLGKKCLNKVKIRFSIVVDADYDSVLNSFMEQIYNDLAQIFGLQTSKDIDIFKVQKGSIKVTGDFHMPQGQTDSNLFLQDTKSKLQSRSKLGQYPILSSQASLFSDSTIIVDPDTPKMSMGILIGVAAGGGVFAIIVIVILIWAIRKYACKKEEINDKEQAKAKAQKNNPQIEKQKQVSQKSSNKSAKTDNLISQNGTNKKPISTNQTDKYLNEAYHYEYPQYLKNQDPTI